MRHLGFDRRGDQRARFAGVVEIVAERIGDRLGHDDRSGEMNDGVDRIAGEQPAQQRGITDIALDELGCIRHRPAEAGRQIVEHDHVLARIEQFEDHMAADEASPTRDQNTHAINLITRSFAIPC
jgi:hypothetical protein